MTKYTILLSDDNTALFQTWAEIAYEEEVDLICCPDWETAKVKLMDDFEGYHAIILDGKGKLNDASKDANSKHLTVATKWLAEEKIKGRFIPAVVFTGFHETISEFQEANDQILKIFQKGENVSSAFRHVIAFLKKEIKNLPEQKFKSAFPDAYTFTKKYFTTDNNKLVRELFDLLTNKAATFIWKKNTLDALRRLNEALVDTIPLEYYLAPFAIDEYLEKIKRESSNKKANRGNRTMSIIEFFHNNEMYVPDPVDYTIRNIYDTGSKFAAHSNETESDYYPSTDMILGLVYSHFGCYHWFGQIIKD